MSWKRGGRGEEGEGDGGPMMEPTISRGWRKGVPYEGESEEDEAALLRRWSSRTSASDDASMKTGAEALDASTTTRASLP